MSRAQLHDVSAVGGGNVTTTGWASFCFGPDELKVIAKAVMQCHNVPHGKGLRLDGHATNKDKNGKITGNNLSPGTIKSIQEERQEAIDILKRQGAPLEFINYVRRTEGEMVPLETDLAANAVFEEEVAAELPQYVRDYYNTILSPITDARLAITMFDDFSHMCTPIALLKERLGVGKVVLGKLGFRERPGQKVYDWEFGDGGVKWM